MAYDCQTKIISEKDCEIFHKNYLKILKAILDNPNVVINDIAL